MDFFAHLFWTAILFRGQGPLWIPIAFAAIPDVFSWGMYLFHRILTGKFKFEKPNLQAVPRWVWSLYGISHSIFVSGSMFLVISIMVGKVYIPSLAWLVHILFDIPTHSRQFLPTPFLWPISKWKFPGFSWGRRWFIILNWTIIALLMIYLFIIRGEPLVLF